MSDRKYRQRGYQDDPRYEPARPAGKPGARPATPPRDRDGPRTPNLMSFHETARCAQCGHEVGRAIGPTSQCPKCGADLHSCRQCVSFSPTSRFECMQPIAARIVSKRARNTCELFEPRVTVERETTSRGPVDPRKAFDDLFK